LGHLVGLLLQLLDGLTTWPNVTLQLLDLVVEHELELLQLLGLLLQVVDALVLVLDRVLTLLQFDGLGGDLVL